MKLLVILFLRFFSIQQKKHNHLLYAVANRMIYSMIRLLIYSIDLSFYNRKYHRKKSAQHV